MESVTLANSQNKQDVILLRLFFWLKPQSLDKESTNIYGHSKILRHLHTRDIYNDLQRIGQPSALRKAKMSRNNVKN